MSTSVRTPDYDAYQAGSGRLNVAAAYHQDQVIASGSVDAGLVGWGTAPQPIRRTITYTNTTDSPIAVELSVDHGTAPAQTFTATADRVTVPARASATVDVVVGTGRPYRRQVLRPGHGPLRRRRGAHGRRGRRRVQEVRPHHPPEGPLRPAHERRGGGRQRRDRLRLHVGAGRKAHRPPGARLLHRRHGDGRGGAARAPLSRARDADRSRGRPDDQPGRGTRRRAGPPGEGGDTPADRRREQQNRRLPLLHLERADTHRLERPPRDVLAGHRLRQPVGPADH